MKEAVMPILRHYFSICCERMRKTIKISVCVAAFLAIISTKTPQI
jgi:hypothetical protein